MKENWKKLILAVIVIFAASSMLVVAASRHTKASAPIRFSATIAEGETLTKRISCYDPDGDNVTIAVEDLPSGAAASAQVNAEMGYSDPDLPPAPAGTQWVTRELTWTPNFTQAGNYTIYIHATDTPGDDDWVKYEITVTNTNRPPVL